MSEPIIEVRDVSKRFPLRRGVLARLRDAGREAPAVHALSDVAFSVARGETFALVGESGCGKSTLARIVMGLLAPSGGSVLFEGEAVERIRGAKARAFRRRVQMVFQNPFGSLNPRMRVAAVVGEPLLVHRRSLGLDRRQIAERVEQSMLECGLDPATRSRFPHQFSGGQRQRIAIARALAVRPACLVLDEPVSALDVSIQAQIVNLLADMQRQHGLTYMFISHDLSLVRCFATRVAVMYLGRICELGAVAEVFDRPRHPYTRGLLAAVPNIKARVKQPAVLGGELPSPVKPPSGCAFHPRCPAATDRCRREAPALLQLATGQFAACHYPLPVPSLPHSPGSPRRLSTTSS